MADAVVTAQQIADFAQAFGNGVEYGGFLVEKRFLRHINDFEVVLNDNLPVVELLHTGEDFQKRRLTRAVAAD